MTRKYRISAPSTPGSRPTIQGAHGNLRDARRSACLFNDRNDLTYQDVRIERADGHLVEYAGPCS